MSWYDDSVSVVSSDAFFMVTGTGLTGLATWEVRGGSSLLQMSRTLVRKFGCLYHNYQMRSQRTQTRFEN